MKITFVLGLQCSSVKYKHVITIGYIAYKRLGVI